MNSVLGLIELGAWELGAGVPIQSLSGSFTASANPSVIATGLGGQPESYPSVPGVIVLGTWELGQAAGKDLYVASTAGRGFFRGRGFPDIGIPQPAIAVSFSASGFPDLVTIGNLGALLIRFKGFPDVSAAGVNYYAEGSFAADGGPDVFLNGISVSYVLATAVPDVGLFPLMAQQIDCASGQNPPVVSSSAPNYVF